MFLVAVIVGVVGIAHGSLEAVRNPSVKASLRKAVTLQFLQRQSLEDLLTIHEITVITLLTTASRGLPEEQLSPRLRRDVQTRYLILRELNAIGHAATRYEIEQSFGARLSVDTVYRQCRVLEELDYIQKNQDDRYMKTEKGHSFMGDFGHAIELLAKKYPDITY
jgi:hypothetical protein